MPIFLRYEIMHHREYENISKKQSECSTFHLSAEKTEILFYRFPIPQKYKFKCEAIRERD